MTFRQQQRDTMEFTPLAPRIGARAQSYSVNAIATITPGASYIQNIRFIYPWNTSAFVTTVPAGERFDFVVDYLCKNSAGNMIDPFSMCIVWWDTVDGPGLPSASAFKLNGYYMRSWDGLSGAHLADPTITDDNSARIANNFTMIMPARNVVLRFNMFANDDNTPAAQYPDPSAWQQLV